MLIDQFRFAWKSLTHKKLRSWLTLIGILIGVMAVVSLIGLGEGLKVAIGSQFGISNTEVLTIQAGGISGAGPPGAGVSDPLTVEDSYEIKQLGSIESTFGRLLRTGSLEFDKNTVYGMMVSMPPGEDKDFAYEVLDLNPIEGRHLKDSDRYKIELGHNFFVKGKIFDKALKVGDSVNVNGVAFEVVGILEKKGSFMFDNMVLMNENIMRDLIDEDEEIDAIVARVKNSDVIDAAKEDVEKLMRKRRDVDEGEEDFEVSTPASMLDSLNEVLTGVQVFIAIIASISIFVGAIGIINTMFTAVMERKKQIGIMKSIGAKNSDIFMIFFIESGLMGFVGGLIGAVLGTIISVIGTIGINNWVNAEMAPTINFWLILCALLGSFLIGSIAGIVPAMNAARQKPVDALRG